MAMSEDLNKLKQNLDLNQSVSSFGSEYDYRGLTEATQVVSAENVCSSDEDEVNDGFEKEREV